MRKVNFGWKLEKEHSHESNTKAPIVTMKKSHYNHIICGMAKEFTSEGAVPELSATNLTAILETLHPHCYSLVLLQTGMLLHWKATYWNAI